jgi:hypothetical protein
VRRGYSFSGWKTFYFWRGNVSRMRQKTAEQKKNLGRRHGKTPRGMTNIRAA